MFTSGRRLLAVENLAVDYGGYVALSAVSLEVRAGEIVCLMGANGSGKSSLLNAVSGLVRPAAGTVVFEGRLLTAVPTYRRLGLGLSPRLVAEVAETIVRLNAAGMTVLFTEQAIHQSLTTAHRGYILESGRLVLSGTSAELLANELLQRVYMGLDLEAP